MTFVTLIFVVMHKDLDKIERTMKEVIGHLDMDTSDTAEFQRDVKASQEESTASSPALGDTLLCYYNKSFLTVCVGA